jgi:hypothetical protein
LDRMLPLSLPMYGTTPTRWMQIVRSLRSKVSKGHHSKFFTVVTVKSNSWVAFIILYSISHPLFFFPLSFPFICHSDIGGISTSCSTLNWYEFVIRCYLSFDAGGISRIPRQSRSVFYIPKFGHCTSSFAHILRCFVPQEESK